MDRTSPLVVALCLAFTAAVCRGQGILTGPENDAVFATVATTFRCAATPGDRVQWVEYATNPNGIVISDGADLIPDHPNFDRYQLDADLAAGTYNLTITSTVVADGGLYECQDENTGTSRGAQLVVIEKAPNCTSTWPPTNFVIEGIRYTVECNIYYRASAGIWPSTSWSGAGDFNQLTVNQSDTILSGLNFDAQKVQDAGYFRMTTFFTESGFGGENIAGNVPTFQNIYNTATIFVRWSPQNVSYTPVKPSYEIGDTLTCNSDSNPLATYVWTDLLTATDYVSQTFTITASMVGQAVFRCQITNQIGTANIFVNTTVNPITTPTTPTTTPTTTPVPAVANCFDITGRWEFIRAPDSKAVLCMYVDGKQNGYINGLFWNDTKTETYYMDIVGRTRNNIYDETGLVGIWPLNIGVSAFAIECQSCYGDETLLLNAVSRTSSDDEFCGDGGNVLTGVQYALKRVAWSYPCGPATTTNELRAISKQAALRRKKRLAASRRI
jgi:hypothetical protein